MTRLYTNKLTLVKKSKLSSHASPNTAKGLVTACHTAPSTAAASAPASWTLVRASGLVSELTAELRVSEAVEVLGRGGASAAGNMLGDEICSWVTCTIARHAYR